MGCGPSLEKYTVVILGLDNAGKSSIMHYLDENEPTLTTTPTIAFRECTILRELKQGKYELHMIDVGGDAKGRDLWRHYISKANAIIFVIDGSDEVRLDSLRGTMNISEDDAKTELAKVINDLNGASKKGSRAPLLIFNNKGDKMGHCPDNEITERLELNNIDKNSNNTSNSNKNKLRAIHIQTSRALDSENNGIFDGIDWLCSALSNVYKNEK